MEAQELMKYKNWAVVGDVLNETKYAYRILNSLKNAGYNVVGVSPSSENSKVYNNLKSVPYKIDVVDLCINPKKGIEISKEISQLCIDKVLIQPGAESTEIVDFCLNKGINALKGCALIELSRR